MAYLLPQGKQQYFDNNGVPLVGGLLYTYEAGTNTPKVTYAEQAGTTPNSFPIVLDSRGEATVFWSGAYKVTLRDSGGAEIWTVDGVIGADIAATVYGSLPPAQPVNGQLWADTNTAPVTLKARIGAVWQAVANLSTGALAQLNAVNTGQIAAEAVNQIRSETLVASGTVSQIQTFPDAYARNTPIIEITFTPTASGVAFINAETTVQYTNASGALAGGQVSIQDKNGAYVDGNERLFSVAIGAIVDIPISTMRTLNVVAGTSYTIGFITAKANAGDTMSFSNSVMTITIVKR